MQLAGLDMGQGFGQHGKQHVHIARQRIVDGWRTAFVGHVQHLGLGARLEHQRCQVLGAAVAG
ncbi:hypothetical protein SDC9_191556 [bioreactor metagenome]|uniref:Uncharacterized protein n=1 Tax=bioreactor metagenome TaxID=1076179 RepID=A0A645HY72_9ZZZZ